MVHIVNQPFQAEGLRHLHAWHGVPERDYENLFKFACFTFPQPKYFESLQITCCPSYWQRKESAAAAPECLGAAEKSCNLTSCKKVAFCNFPRKPTPSLPPPISILCYSTCSSMSSSSLATTILNRSLESTTKMMPCKVDMPRVMKVRRSTYLAVSVVVLPQVSVPALARHVKGSEADVSVWKDNMSEEVHLQHLLAVILNKSAIKIQNQGKIYIGHAVNSPPALSGTIPFLVSWVNTSTSALCMAPFKDGEEVFSHSILFIFSISLIANLVDYLAASLDDHLSGEHPLDCVAKLHIRWSGHSGGFLFRLLLFIRLSIMWVEREICCWKRKTQVCGNQLPSEP